MISDESDGALGGGNWQFGRLNTGFMKGFMFNRIHLVN
jgi:hypothetical protein